MLLFLVMLTVTLVVPYHYDTPTKLRQTKAVIRVMNEYLAVWERLPLIEKSSPVSLEALVSGVENVILKEDPLYVSNAFAVRATNVELGRLRIIMKPQGVPAPDRSLLEELTQVSIWSDRSREDASRLDKRPGGGLSTGTGADARNLEITPAV